MPDSSSTSMSVDSATTMMDSHTSSTTNFSNNTSSSSSTVVSTSIEFNGDGGFANEAHQLSNVRYLLTF